MDSSTTVLIIAAIGAIVIIVGAVSFLTRRRNSARLRSSFGAEYDRTLEAQGDQRKAEQELRDRQKRVSGFELTPLTMASRDNFVARWRDIQAEFVDQPKTALDKADNLLTEVMRARGYPVEDFEQRTSDLSVDHPDVVQNYRAGRDIALRHQRGDASTEDLRQAMIHYRALFDELVGEVADAS